MTQFGGDPVATTGRDREESGGPEEPGGPDDLAGIDEVEDPQDDPEDTPRHARRPLSTGRRAASWAGDRAPAPVAGLTFGAPHLVVVGMLLLGGLLLGGWCYLQSTGGAEAAGEVVAPRATGGVQITSGEPPGAPPGEPPGGSTGVLPGAPPASATGAAGAASSPLAPGVGGATGAAPAELVVDVEGKVRRPGIAVLPVGSRVVDALEAAGGARPGTDLGGLNLARLLVDGEQLLVGVDPPAGVAAGALTGPSAPVVPGTGTAGAGGASPPPALVDLNTADQVTLETLPGVGPVTAAAILEWRSQHGAFTTVDELLEVSGIGDATLAELAPHVTL